MVKMIGARRFYGGLAALPLAALLSGCAATMGDFCDVQPGPIRPEPADVDVISDSLGNQILALNEKGAALCGWMP